MECIEYLSWHIGNAETIGIFGDYQNLILHTEHRNICSFRMQDLAGNEAFDVTEEILFSNGNIRIPGKLIREIGTSGQPDTDSSEAGVLFRIVVSDT